MGLVRPAIATSVNVPQLKLILGRDFGKKSSINLF